MNTLRENRIPPVLWVAIPIAIAALDVWLVHDELSRGAIIASGLGLLALFASRRFPIPVFVCVLPTLVLGAPFLITAIAAFEVGRRVKSGAVALACVCAIALLLIIGEYPAEWSVEIRWFVSSVIFSFTVASAPVLLGRLVASRIALQEKLTEVVRAREESSALHAQTVLARDRAQLAREMHDVVSHQVSLIAVRAGALEMQSADTETAAAAETIRELSVKTLEELRYMVTVLRASGSEAAGLTPQPTVAQLPDLIGDCGLAVSVTGELPDGLPAATQRAVYRTLQEALTNVRKHASGARVSIDFGATESQISVVVTNTPGSGPRLALPGSGHGLQGLAERAVLLDGSLGTQHLADGGFRIDLRLPR